MGTLSAALWSAEITAYSAEARIAHMESAFGVVLPHSVRVNQAPTLGAAFRLAFQIRGDLRFDPLIDYLIAHPDELMALRDYLQRLTDDGVIGPDFVVQVLR